MGDILTRRIPDNTTRGEGLKRKSKVLSTEAIATINTLNAAGFETGLRKLARSRVFSKLSDSQKAAAIEEFTARLREKIAKIVEKFQLQ